MVAGEVVIVNGVLFRIYTNLIEVLSKKLNTVNSQLSTELTVLGTTDNQKNCWLKKDQS